MKSNQFKEELTRSSSMADSKLAETASFSLQLYLEALLPRERPSSGTDINSSGASPLPRGPFCDGEDGPAPSECANYFLFLHHLVFILDA